MVLLSDESKMFFGIHRGKKLIDVPALYLLELLDDEPWLGRAHPELKAYIKKNQDGLELEAGEKDL